MAAAGSARLVGVLSSLAPAAVPAPAVAAVAAAALVIFNFERSLHSLTALWASSSSSD
jgi:hypothetical protein